MAQTPVSSTPTTANVATDTGTETAQTLNGLEPGNAGQAQLAANLSNTTGTAIASADAPAAVRGVDMGMIKDTSGPNINPDMLNASAQIQVRQAQAQANPALLNVSAKTGPIGYTAMKFGAVEQLNKPAAGQTATVHADAGEQLKVNFDPNAAQLSVRHGDLIFTFNDGSRLVVDHFVMAGNQMPSLLLPDGTLLAGGVVVAQLTGQNSDDLFNIETAAGPGAGGAGGGGNTRYSDDLGGVIGLLDKLPPIPFTDLAFPRPADQITPFVFPIDSTPGPQSTVTNVDDESFGFTNGPLTGTIVPDFGRDGPGTLTLSPDFTATGSLAGGQLTSHGSPITTTFNGNTVTGTDGNGNVIFTILVKPDGSYEFNLNGQLDHADKTNPDDIINLNFTYVVTDADGDASTGSLIVRVKDDAPIANDDFNRVYNNDTITGNVITGLSEPAGGADHLSNDMPNKVTNVVSFDGTSVNFNANGDAVVIQGQYGVLTIKPDGSYSYHHTDSTTGLDLHDKFTYTLTDYDGDSEPAVLDIRIDDGVPQIPPVQGGLRGDNALDESNFVNGMLTKSDVITFTNSPFSPSTTVALGNPAAGAVQFTATGSVAGTTLHSNGQDVHVVLDGNKYVGFTGNDVNAAGAKVFELVLKDGAGHYDFTQFQNLDHANASDPNDAIQLNFAVTATDADGDNATGNLQITVLDDAPDAHADVNHAVRQTISYDFSQDAPNYPSLLEYTQLPTSQHDLYAQGAAKASSVTIGYPTTITIERISDEHASVAGRSPVFACTLRADGTIGNVQLVLSNGVSDPQYASGPAQGTYTMTDAGKLGFFIVSGGTIALEREGVIDSNGNLNAGYTFSLRSDTNDSHGYVVQYTKDGVTHDLPFYEANGTVSNPTTEARFAGSAFDTPDTNEFGLVHGIAGRESNDAANTLRYAFEDGNLRDPGNDRDYNDVQFKITVNPVNMTTNPIIDGNVITGRNGGEGAMDHVGQDDLQPGLTLGTKVTQISFEQGAFNPFAATTTADQGGKYITMQGEYGVLKMYENGEYTYNYNKQVVNGDLKDVFHYTIIDNDGDTSTITLTIALDNNFIPTINVNGARLDEHDLTVQPNPDSVSSSVTVSSPDGINSVVLTTQGLPQLSANGQPVTYQIGNDGHTLTGSAGGQPIFTVSVGTPQQANGTYTVPYTFTLIHPLDNSGDGRNTTNIPVQIAVTDGTGDVVNANIPLQVVDDVPQAHDDSFGLGFGTSVSGNIINDDNFGADGRGTPALTSVTFNGETKDVNGSATFTAANGETLTVNNNGDFTYTRAAGFGNVSPSFTYTIQDHDGDKSTAKVRISGNDNPVIIITPPPPPPGSDINANATPALLDEHDLTAEPNPDSVQQTITFTAPDGFQAIMLSTENMPALTVKGQPVDFVVSPDGHAVTGTANGQVVMTVVVNGNPTGGNGSYTTSYVFTLNQPLDNSGDDRNVTHIPVKFVVTDTDGDSATSVLPLQIRDDVPVAHQDSLALGNAPASAPYGNDNLLVNDTFGADGPSTGSLINNVTKDGVTKSFDAPEGVDQYGARFVTFTNAAGTLQVSENGTYSFVRANGANGDLNQQFDYTIKDHDGDISTAHVTITGNINTLPTVGSDTREVDETSGVDANGGRLSQFNDVTGQIAIDYKADGPAASNAFTLTGLTIDGATNLNALTSGGVPVAVALSNNEYTGTANGEAVFKISVDSNGNYAYHQFKQLDHNNISDSNETIGFHVGYTVKDQTGDTASGSVTINVHDDAPVTSDDNNELTIQTYTFNVLGGAPDFPSLVEYKHLPENQPDLYRMGAEKASNVVIDRPTTIDIERIVDTGASVAGRSPVFACTLRADGTIGNIQLVLSNGTSDPQYASGPDHTTYTMTDPGKLGFFIVSGGTIALEREGVIDSNGNLNAGYTFSLRADPNDGHGYVVQYTTPQGVTHDLPFYEADGTVGFPMTEARFAGSAFDTPDTNEFGLVHGIAGRESNDAANTLRYAFEDGNLRDPGNDRDYNDVQFKITVNPTVVQVSPPISGNVLPNDRVGEDMIAGHSYGTLVTQIALGMGAFVAVEGAMNSDSTGRYVDIQGEYGVLRMHDNGEYSYNFNGNKTSGDLVDDFRYVIRDADRDTSNVSTLTIHIHDNGQAAEITQQSMARLAVSEDVAMTVVATDEKALAQTTLAIVAANVIQPDAFHKLADVNVLHAPHLDAPTPLNPIGPAVDYPPSADASGETKVDTTVDSKAASDVLPGSVHGEAVVQQSDVHVPHVPHHEDPLMPLNPIGPAVDYPPFADAPGEIEGQVAHDGTNRFTLDTHVVGDLTSDGQPIDVKMADGVLHGSVSGENVFTLALDDAGHYQFSLQGKIDQAQDGDGTTLAFGYGAVDRDGAAVEGQLVIGVQGSHVAAVPAATETLALHDLVSTPADHSAVAHADVQPNILSHVDIISSILDNHDPYSGHNNG